MSTQTWTWHTKPIGVTFRLGFVIRLGHALGYNRVMPADVIYLDNHATTRVDPRVVDAMLPYFTEQFGNPGSVSHAFGWEAREAVDRARETIAAAIGASARELVFTSGATESNNLALRGVAERARRKGNHFVSVKTEHKSILDPLDRLSRRDFAVTLLDPLPGDHPRAGWLDPAQVSAAITDQTLLVSVMLANNEIGVIQPLAEIGRICHERGVLLHCDATQAVGKLPVDVTALGVDLLSFTAHKIYGPKGIGALYVRRSPPPVKLQPLIDGGGQEGGVRSGTLNVPGIVGFARTVELCLETQAAEAVRLAGLRNRLYAGLLAAVSGVRLNGPALDAEGLRLAGNLNCSFDEVDGEALMMAIKTVAVSSGSACTSANPEPSHVLRALGYSHERTRASLRFGLGRFTTPDHIDHAIAAVSAAVEKLRKLGGAVDRAS
ncbi:MAG: aminotransferase class V-fold PLP-dependent enzyme [Planctomycetaceae bacterium]|nr:aminotransferase class V-fold PLP-dependent enzyme [Planctomycetaceae bacterium]